MKFTQEQRNLVRTAEVHRSEAQRLYNYAARTLKNYSIGIYNRLSDFVAQDENIILALKGILVEMEMDVPADPDKNKITVNIIPIIGLGELPGEGGENESILKILENFCVSLAQHEKTVLENWLRIKEETTESFQDFFSQRLDLQGLISISSDRLRVIADLAKRGKGFFRDRPSDARWRCTYCGLVVEGSDAPEECPCCRQPKGYFETGGWTVMPAAGQQ